MSRQLRPRKKQAPEIPAPIAFEISRRRAKRSAEVYTFQSNDWGSQSLTN